MMTVPPPFSELTLIQLLLATLLLLAPAPLHLLILSPLIALLIQIIVPTLILLHVLRHPLVLILRQPLSVLVPTENAILIPTSTTVTATAVVLLYNSNHLRKLAVLVSFFLCLLLHLVLLHLNRVSDLILTGEKTAQILIVFHIGPPSLITFAVVKTLKISLFQDVLAIAKNNLFC